MSDPHGTPSPDAPQNTPDMTQNIAEHSAAHTPDSPIHDDVRGEHDHAARDPQHTREKRSGIIAWMAQNSVAANLLMALLLVGGLMIGLSVKREVFPQVDVDVINVNVAYPGANPDQSARGIAAPLEYVIASVEGVKEVSSTSYEGGASINAELMDGVNARKVLEDVKGAVEQVRTLPREAEAPRFRVWNTRDEVISLVIYGDASERALSAISERARGELIRRGGVTVMEIHGRRAPLMKVELSEEAERRWKLTPNEVATAITAATRELPAGAVQTAHGEVRVRVAPRDLDAHALEQIVVRRGDDGGLIRLGQVAEVTDGHDEGVRAAYFNGKRALRVDVFRVGTQDPIRVAQRVKDFSQQRHDWLPPGVKLAVWDDSTEAYRSRIELLLENAAMGLVLVLVALGLFLELRLAFWVTLGIPISFLGAMWVFPAGDVSINMITLFAFIIVLGIVVDDAIVVGEAVYTHRQEGMGRLDAAIAGAREVGMPVIFSVLTTVLAFVPMLFVPGIMGKFFRMVPLVVIPVLLVSLVESLLVLPAHLAHGGEPRTRLGVLQQRFSAWTEETIARLYDPIMRVALPWRYATLAVGVAALVIVGALASAGNIKYIFFPKIAGDVLRAGVQFPPGTPVDRSESAMRKLVKDAQDTAAKLGQRDAVRGVYAQVGRGFRVKGDNTYGSHLSRVSVYLVSADHRRFTTEEFARAWRGRIGTIDGVDHLQVDYNSGPSDGASVTLNLSHPDNATLEQAARELARRLGTFEGVHNIDSGVETGKEQINLTLTPTGEALGMSQQDLAAQLRAAFMGREVSRHLRDREELRVMILRPKPERTSAHTLEHMTLRTTSGGEVALRDVAHLERGNTYGRIRRERGARVITVRADIDVTKTTPAQVMKALQAEHLPALRRDAPGLTWSRRGQQKNRDEFMGYILRSSLIALLAMFGLMAVAFRSYIQPIIIMIAIPFGIGGAIVGHVIMGVDLSMVSILGMVALAGVVVNDSLVLIVAINTLRDEGLSLMDALVQAGIRRFRPIMLTSVTTCVGLGPMIFERSTQAQFLIPMAISLGFGLLFVTFITLVIVPALYMMIEDIRHLWRAYWAWGLPARPGPTSDVNSVRNDQTPA